MAAWPRFECHPTGPSLHDPLTFAVARSRRLIVQGTADTFVLEPLQTPFVDKLKGTGAPVTYKRYAGADRFSIFRQPNADVRPFLHERFAK